MKRLRCLFTRPSFILGLLLLVASGSWAQLPDRIESNDPEWPYFISAEAAKNMSSQDLAYPFINGTRQHLLSLPNSEECIRFSFQNTGYVPRGQKPELKKLIQHVDSIITAVVEGSTTGFRGNEPGRLLKLRLEEPLKGTVNFETVFLFMAAGELEISGRRYCMTNPGVPEPPANGERLLLFLYENSFSRENSTLLVPVTHLVSLPAQAPVRASSHLEISELFDGTEKKSVPNTEELLDMVRRQLSSTKGRMQP